ncbi:MAG TPA: transcription elongation factor GreA [Chloroflexota bacterium]|nr:transcription elongation factor GreA [Chloroflexota bacterium]
MAAQQPILVTEDEKKKIDAELNELVKVRRPEIAQKIGQAAADGDLSENGAYHHAKEQQGHIEGRIAELEFLSRNVVVVEPERAGSVGLGNTVEIKDDRGGSKTYRIVGVHGARPSEGLISVESPLGAALQGRKKGDRVQYKTPAGEERTVTILSVE